MPWGRVTLELFLHAARPCPFGKGWERRKRVFLGLGRSLSRAEFDALRLNCGSTNE